MTAREPVEGWRGDPTGGLILDIPGNRFGVWYSGGGWWEAWCQNGGTIKNTRSCLAAQLAAEDYAKQQLKAALDALENEK